MDIVAFVFGLCGMTFGLVGMTFAITAVSKLNELDARVSAIESTP